MIRLAISDIIKATGGTLQGKDSDTALSIRPGGVSIDTRTLARGDIFFALAGDRCDGHSFLGQAFAKGARAAVVTRPWVTGHGAEAASCPVCIEVDDTVTALQECARLTRSLLAVPLVAVTGTNGKTTTKDMIWAVLSKRYRCLRSEGNFNNHIGLPLTLLRAGDDAQALVVELAMRAPGEIARLGEICSPQFGVITNVGPAHLEFFPGIEEIARAKGELLDALGPEHTAVLNADDPLVMSQAGRMKGKVITFGLGPGAQVRARDVQISPQGSATFRTDEGIMVQLEVPGRHMICNALAAIAVGRELEVPPEAMVEALARVPSQPMRMEMIHIDGLQVLNDAYNANPVSMRAALQTLPDIKGAQRRIAVLGDMLELGKTAEQKHAEIGRFAAQAEVDLLFTVGRLARLIAEGARQAGMAGHRVRHFETRKHLIESLVDELQAGDLVLVKGSRLMGLETVVAAIRETWMANHTQAVGMN